MRLLIENTLLEDIWALKKYYPNIPDDEYKRILSLDPTYKGGDNAGNYAKWILGLANKGKLDNLGHVSDILKRFDDNKKNLKNKDIMKYKSIEELETYLNDENSYNQLSRRQELRQTQKAVHNTNLDIDAKKVYEDSKWEIWVPLTYEASCKLGRDTRWCTASTESDYYYDMYSHQGPLYININKHNGEKYQFHFESNQFMDSDDYSINLLDFIERHNLDNFYLPILYKSYGLDSSGYGTFRLQHTDLAKELQTNDISSEFLEACMEDNLFEYFSDNWSSYSFATDDYLYYYDNLNSDNKDLLYDLNIDSENLKHHLNNNSELRWLFATALDSAYMVGSIDAATIDFNKAITEAMPCDFENKYEDGYYNLFITPESIKSILHDSYDEYRGANDDLKDTLLYIINENFKFYEPYNGWEDFDDIEFNNVFNGNFDKQAIQDSYEETDDTLVDFELEESLKEDYEYFDYNTEDILDNKYIDITRQEMSHYQDYLDDPEGTNKYHKTTSEIVEMSPKEYFEKCAEIFESTFDNQYRQIKEDEEVIEHLKNVILKLKKKFPIPIINYAEKKPTQDGRHRMFVLGELFGWDEKYPVLVVYPTDEGKQLSRQEEIYNALSKISNNALKYTYTSLDNFMIDLEYAFEDKFADYIDSYLLPNIEENKDSITVSFEDTVYNIEKYEVKIDPNKNDDLEDELDIDDILNDPEYQNLLI